MTPPWLSLMGQILAGRAKTSVLRPICKTQCKRYLSQELNDTESTDGWEVPLKIMLTLKMIIIQVKLTVQSDFLRSHSIPYSKGMAVVHFHGVKKS